MKTFYNLIPFTANNIDDTIDMPAKTQSESENDAYQYWYYYSAGFSFGKRINLSGRRRTYMDIGFGASY